MGPGHLLILCLCLKVLKVHASSWKAEVPQTVPAVRGSCVVIPCTFSYPGAERKPSDLTGIWQTEHYENIFHPDSSKVTDRFRGRTNLIGNLGRKNCTLRINRLQSSDSGPFWFRIKIDDFDNYSYRDNKVSVVIKDSPTTPSLTLSEEVKVGEVVSASCSVLHSCPSDPPVLKWSYNGTPSMQTEWLSNGEWKVTSQLTFTATIADHNKTLTCTAEFSKKKSVWNAAVLNVKYSPVSVRVHAESTVKEGDAVQMRCSSDSNPPASYHWYNSTGALQAEGNTYTLENVSRYTGAVYCIAINTEGQRSSSLVKINVEYAPEIKEGSACSTKIFGVTCLCVVDSNPAGEINWLLPGETLPGSSTERHGSITLNTLQRSEGVSHAITCHASNSHGNTTETFFLSQNDKLLYSLIPVFTVLLIATMAILVWVARRHWGNNDQLVSDVKDVDAMKEKASYSMTSRKEERGGKTSGYADHEFNAHIYSNIEAGENCDVYMNQEDAIYGNV